jgi:hypothetical protein
MAKVVTQFDLDLALIQQKTAQMKQMWKQAAADARSVNLADNLTAGVGSGSGRAMAAGAVAGRGRGGMIGNAGMQFQDIAVQAQMGTSASVIIGQQGSQMLGALGPMGAVAGAAVAIGAAFVTMGQKGKEQFETLKKESEEFAKAQEQLLAAGDGAALAAGYALIESRIKSLNETAESGYSVWGRFKSLLAETMGSVSADEKDAVIQAQQAKAIEQAYEVQKRALQVSAEELEIAKARAAGEMEKVRSMERAKALAVDIAKIEASSLPGGAKRKLIEDAKEKSEIEGKAQEDKIFSEESDKQVKAILDLEADIKSRQIAALPPVERAAALGRELQDTLRKGNESNPTMEGLNQRIKEETDLTEKARLLALMRRAMEQEAALKSLMPAEAERVYQAKTPFGKAAGFFSGVNPNEMIAVEIKNQSSKVEESNQLLKQIRDALKPTGRPGEPVFE